MTKNERRTTKNGWKSSRNHPRKRYGSTLAWIFFTETIFFSIILSDPEIPDGLNPFLFHSSPYLLENRGRPCHPARPGEPGCFLQKQPPSGGTSWKDQVGLIAICTPIFTKYTPCFVFGDSFSVTLRNFTNFVTMLVFFL